MHTKLHSCIYTCATMYVCKTCAGGDFPLCVWATEDGAAKGQDLDDMAGGKRPADQEQIQCRHYTIKMVMIILIVIENIHKFEEI